MTLEQALDISLIDDQINALLLFCKNGDVACRVSTQRTIEFLKSQKMKIYANSIKQSFTVTAQPFPK
jgi:hypothetical protein